MIELITATPWWAWIFICAGIWFGVMWLLVKAADKFGVEE